MASRLTAGSGPAGPYSGCSQLSTLTDEASLGARSERGLSAADYCRGRPHRSGFAASF